MQSGIMRAGENTRRLRGDLRIVAPSCFAVKPTVLERYAHTQSPSKLRSEPSFSNVPEPSEETCFDI